MKDISPFNLLNKQNSNSSAGNDLIQNSVSYENKIWIVVHESGEILFSNDKCKNEWNLYEGDDFSKINSEPDLVGLINNLNSSNYGNFTFELFVDTGEESKTFNAEIERVIMASEKYFVLVFNTFEDHIRLEAKISNLHHALEYGQIPVIMTDEKGKIVYATKSFEKLLELDLDVIYNNHLSSILSWYLSNEELADVQGAIAKGREWSTNIYIKSNDDENQVLDLKLNPVNSEDGNSRSFILTGHDVSSYYQKNRVIKKSEEKLRSIINNISDLMLIFKIKNDEYIYEDSNIGFKELFGLQNSDVHNHALKKLIPSDFTEKLSTSLTLMQKNKLNAVEYDCNGPKGRNYAAKLSFQYDSNLKTNLYILSLRDITERILNEKQIKEAYKKEIQMNKLKTTFLQNMSHELRTPATAVMGYSEIMKDCIANKDYEAIDEITKSLESVVKRLIDLFTKIIEISEIESEEVEIQKVKLNCNKIVKSIYKQKLPIAKEKNLELNLHLSDSNELIEIDWSKFEKTLDYLIDNAIKYSAYGSVDIITSVEPDDFVIKISDTGRGMNQKIVDWLLEPFVQEDEDGLTREYEGSGLGLTIANKYTRLMGGIMKIESAKNVGTSIEIRFPVLNRKLN